MTIPTLLIAGDTLSFTYDISEYSSDDGYSATFLLNSSAQSYSVSSSGVGAEYSFSETSANTSSWVAGTYTYWIYISKTGEHHTIITDEIEIKANVVSGPIDIRTHAQKVLDSINAVLENRAGQDYTDYNLPGGLSVSKLDPVDLLKFKKEYEAIRRQEVKAEDIRNGKTSGNIVKARF
ncbi:MAG: hypothetical protein COA79_20960 [Planctomycetota bacterium]|nr:MAG: hypothetical protein COA79_20960 [Planctomycetota bacterium]